MVAVSLTAEDRQWISDLLEANMNRVKEEFTGELNQKLEGMETRLLTAFHTRASPVETRQRSHSAALRAIDVELEA